MLSPASLEQLISTYIYGIPAGEKHWFKRSLICSGGRGSMWVYFLKLCELVGQSQVEKIGSFENGEDWQCRQALLQVLQILPLLSLAVWPCRNDLCFIECEVGRATWSDMVYWADERIWWLVCLVSLTWLAWWRNRASGFFMHFQMLILRPTGTWA